MEDGLKQFNLGISVVLIIIFIFSLYCSMVQDKKDLQSLDKIVCHKEIDLPRIRTIDKLIIESITEKYLIKRSMNKSKYSKIIGCVKSGVIRGAIGGAIAGTLGGAVSGAIFFGVMGGLSGAYQINYGTRDFKKDYKHT